MNHVPTLQGYPGISDTATSGDTFTKIEQRVTSVAPNFVDFGMTDLNQFL